MASLDELFMREALAAAREGFEAGEVPVGAVLVYNGEVIARAHNRVEELNDVSAHAELLCIREGGRKLQNWRLLDTILYSTLEPCAQCAGAILLSRVGTLVWGAPDLRHGAGGSWTNLFALTHPTHELDVRGGVLQEEAASLMREFFSNVRISNR